MICVDCFVSDVILTLDFVLFCFLCRSVVRIVLILTGISSLWENGCNRDGEVVEVCYGTGINSVWPSSFDEVRMSDPRVCL